MWGFHILPAENLKNNTGSDSPILALSQMTEITMGINLALTGSVSITVAKTNMNLYLFWP